RDGHPPCNTRPVLQRGGSRPRDMPTNTETKGLSALFTNPSRSGRDGRLRACPRPTPSRIISSMPVRHFVKYTFLKVDPAWRRLDDEQRESDKREFMAACSDFADGHLLRA